MIHARKTVTVTAEGDNSALAIDGEWENEIVAAVLAGVTNARSESLNRIAKLEARHAYGFRNPASQRRRVRTACTRGTRRNNATTSRHATNSNQTEPHPRLISQTRVLRQSHLRGVLSAWVMGA